MCTDRILYNAIQVVVLKKKIHSTAIVIAVVNIFSKFDLAASPVINLVMLRTGADSPIVFTKSKLVKTCFTKSSTVEAAGTR